MNNETKEALTKELKLLQETCKHVYNLIEYFPDEVLIPNNIEAKTLNYVEALRPELCKSNTALNTCSNLLTNQFLSKMDEQNKEVEILIDSTKRSISDMDIEIDMLNNLINTAKEFRSTARAKKKDIRQITKADPDIHPQAILKAKARFRMIRKELYRVIYSLCPNSAHLIKDVLGHLIQESLDVTSDGYIQLTRENYLAIKILKKINIVTENPNNKREVKLFL
ncbi:unnamed protein product [Parnassius apollo]|uniref:(apollo) hypothetical protein n=1 Tax=Parnassius apollo TaxID=110799 RepID=A0A8S3WWN6_PARAO|nr:unnamed protein product [Parnassius apollo]CAG4984266.1 unnamed protein product [Parnassius apollo]